MLRRVTSAFATVALIAFFLAACSGDSTTTTTSAAAATTAANASGTITVSLADVDANTMLLTPTPASAPAGEVTFEVTNSGSEEHEFVVVQTDLALDDLPFDEAADEVIEDELTVVDEIESLMPGETKTLTVTLESGGYALICNLEGHFRKGMRSAFTVN